MNNFKDKKIVILGFGKEGLSTYEYIRKFEKEMPLVIMDNKYQDIKVEDSNVSIIDIDYDSLKDYDLIFKSPGISFKGVDISLFRDKITSQLEYFLDNKKGYVIGITGTKGKSTTSSLIYSIIASQGYKTFLLGNIGNPIFEVMDDIDEESYVVIEMSSHQLEYVTKSPDIAIILNLFEEHLDHYDSLDAYYKAKLNIAKYQGKDDYFLYSSDNNDLDNYKNLIQTESHKYDITFERKENSYAYLLDDNIVVNDNKVFDLKNEINLKGMHNIKDIMFALTVASILNLEEDKVVKSICEFKPLPHRMELVGTFNDIIFYNDSIATIPDATINAINSLDKIDTLILGGMDRKISYEYFIEFLKNTAISNFICLPDTGHYIYEQIKDIKSAYKVDNMQEAVAIAKRVTKKGSVCLLSPAASSYGFFKNFEDRGNTYKKLVTGK